MTLHYPDEPIDEDFPRPPRTVRDYAGRRIKFERAGTGDRSYLMEMYLTFESRDRAQGIPPSGEDALDEWLEIVMEEESLNVIAWHRRDAIGHAMLVADSDGSYEVAIFVKDGYRGSGIGTELMRTTLGAAQDAGIARVWLSVERWNEPAVALYDNLGFQRMADGGFEIEMTIRLASEQDSPA